jgi:hypothetical protein
MTAQEWAWWKFTRWLISPTPGSKLFIANGGNSTITTFNLDAAGFSKSRGTEVDDIHPVTGHSGNNSVTEADLPDGTNPVVRTITTLKAPDVVAVYRAP